MEQIALWSHDAVLSPRASNVARARAFTRDHLEQHHLPYLVDDVRLVVSELVTNAVVHARTQIVVTIQGMPSCVRLQVTDRSTEAPAPRLAHDADVGGRGLQVVERYASDWGTELGDNDKSVWALFPTREEVHPAAATAEGRGSLV
jgi:anti-sigma regulatory factor (Ser/Thr protein kinase)